jgi:hypothetical protein
MWIMLITFLFYASPQDHASNASLSTAEFSTKESCEGARDAYLGQFTKITGDVNEQARASVESSVLREPIGISVTALCVRK